MKLVACKRITRAISSLLHHTPSIFKGVHYKDRIIINAYTKIKWGKICHQNWGDDINYYFIQNITNKKIIIFSNSLLSYLFFQTNYLCIGSTIQRLVNSKTIIWGSGVISDKAKLSVKPKKVLAVRGPLTRKYLLERNIECPEVYGDPALLLSKYYNPIVTKKYKLGIIPHYADQDNIYLRDFLKKNKDSVKYIDLVHYLDWHEIIDQICECEFIVSSSLHGIIISDSYKIPNYWIEFSKKVAGNGFKFFDYFASVHRNNISHPFSIDSHIHLDDLLSLKVNWNEPVIDLDRLLEVCPFKDL